MTAYYVYSGAAGTADGSSWANAYTTLLAAITAKAAGSTYYVAHDHAETNTTAVTLGFPGTAAAPDKLICVNRAGSVPPVSADLRKRSGSLARTSTGSIIINGAVHVYGLQIVTATGGMQLAVVNGVDHIQKYEGCQFEITGASGSVNWSDNGGREQGRHIEWVDTPFKTANAASFLSGFNGRLLWRDTPSALPGAAAPTTLFKDTLSSTQEMGGEIVVDGVDLSAASTGCTLVGSLIATWAIRILNCKIGAAVTVAAAAPSQGGARIDLLNCDSAGNGYRQERYWYQGTLKSETTVVRTGGASDGTQALSHKITTTANSNYSFPFETFEYLIWNDTTGAAKTVTVEMVTDNVTLKDNEAWLEAQCLDAAGAPLGALYSSGSDILAAGANDTASVVAWTTTGLTTPVKQKMAITFTPAIKGYIRIIVKIAKPSTTVYVDPKPTVT